MKIVDKKYFDIRRRLVYNLFYYILFGKRKVGKTYSVKYHIIDVAVKSWYKYKQQDKVAMFYWFRRTRALNEKEIHKWDEDFVGRWNLLITINGIWLCEIQEKTNRKGETKVINKKLCLIGLFGDLWNPENYRGARDPRIKNIVMDEFIKEFGNYLSNEPQRFMSILTSIVADRDDCDIFILANDVDNSSPWFAAFGMHPDLLPEKVHYKIYPHKKIFIEYVAPSQYVLSKAKDSNLGKLLSGSDYEKFSTTGGWMTDSSKFILSNPTGQLEYQFNFIVLGKELTVYKYVAHEWWISEGREYQGQNWYGTQIDADVNGEYFNSPEWIAYAMREKAMSNSLWFKTNDIKDIIIEWLQKFK